MLKSFQEVCYDNIFDGCELIDLQEKLKRSDEYDRHWEDEYKEKKHKVTIGYNHRMGPGHSYIDDDDYDSYYNNKKTILSRVKRKLSYLKKGQHYNITFAVDDRFERSKFDPTAKETPQTARHILRSVGSRIHHFIKKERPASITLDGNTAKKKEIYRSFAHHLAKVHNGRVESVGGTHIVHFGGR